MSFNLLRRTALLIQVCFPTWETLKITPGYCAKTAGLSSHQSVFCGSGNATQSSTTPPVLLQSFSCVDTSVQIQRKYGRVAEGDPSHASILHSPLVSNAVLNATEEQRQLLADLLADFVANNSIVNKHLTAWEMVDCFGGSPILTSSVMQNITQQARERGPLNEYQNLQQHFPRSLLEMHNYVPRLGKCSLVLQLISASCKTQREV